MLRKNTAPFRILLLLFSALSLNAWAGTLYWVNNSGNWNNAMHWSRTSGGKGGAGIPGISDDVVFDLNSFSNPGEQVTITGDATCHSMQWSPYVYRPVLEGTIASSLNVYGSLTLSNSLNWQFNGHLNFKSSQQNNVISTGAVKLTGTVSFNGNGSWKLGSILLLSPSAVLKINSGSLYANGNPIVCSVLKITGTASKLLDLSNSTLTVEKQYDETGAQNFQHNYTNCNIYYMQRLKASDLNALKNYIPRKPTGSCGSDVLSYSGTSITCNHSDTGLTNNGTITVNVTPGTCGPYTYSWSNGQTTSTANNLAAGTYSVIVTDGSGDQYFGVDTALGEPNPLGYAGILKQSPTCFGDCNGWIGIKIHGGTPNYTYSWSNGGGGTAIGSPSNYVYDSNLCAGTYKVHVTDANGCHNTLNPAITLISPTKVTVTITSTNPKCNTSCNGTATATASGGHPYTAPTPSYTYLWSPGGQTTQTATNLCSGTYTVIVTDSAGCTGKDSVTITPPTPLTVTMSHTNASCNGTCDGTATATPGGGTAPYIYSWSTAPVQTTQTATGLCAGNYTVTVTDANGCTTTGTVKITQPTKLIVNVTGSPLTLQCFGDCQAIISTSVSGGTAPFTYLWNTGATSSFLTNQCAGTYSVTVTDAHGCTGTGTVTISQPPQLVVTITSAINPSCNGTCNGSISASVSGGTAPYSYKWSPGGQTTLNINGLCAGGDTLTVTDANGCTAIQKVTLIQPTPLTITPSITNVSCNGSCDGKAVANVSGGTAPYTYTWNNNAAGTVDSITGLCAGNDSLTVTDAAGCSSTLYFSISQATPLSITVTSNNASCTACNGKALISVSGGTAPYTYSWAPGGQTADSATNLCTGSYTVTVTDAHGCTQNKTIVIVPTVKIIITSSATGVSCHNGCDGLATANASGGTTPYTYSWNNGENGQTDTLLCGGGTYIVTVNDSKGCFNTDTVSFTNPPQLVGTTSQTNLSCSGTCVGTASVTASGGTPPYTYSWNTGATTSSINGLCLGQYIVTIFDSKNCSTSDTVNIIQNPPIAANPTVVQPTCGNTNGSITLSTSGGVPPYTYSWNTGATTQNLTNLGGGVYIVTITDATGCTKSFTIPLSNTTGPVVTSIKRNTSCWNTCDGFDSVSVTGNSPFTYSWSPNGETTDSITNLCPGVYICSVTDNAGCITNLSDTITKPAVLVPNPTIQNVSCNGNGDGSISFAPTGGTPPYKYLWAPPVSITSSANNLGPGTYTINISDADGCDSAVTITITEPPVLSVTLSSTNVLCNGNCNGTATATVSGGTSPYIYNWSNGAILPNNVNLCPGGYTVNVTDINGCAATANVTITEPAALSDVMSHTDVSCNGGSDGTATITVSGGTMPYSYSWNPGQTTSSISGVSAGKYVVTVTDNNGCSITDSVIISEPAPLAITFTSTNITCNSNCDGKATGTVTGGTTPYTYSWSGGGTTDSLINLCTGTYTLSVTDAHGCPISNNVTITQPLPLQANATSTNTKCPTSCDGTATSSPVGGTPPYSYSWSTVPVQNTQTATNLCAGTYTVTVTDANMCTDMGVVTINNPAAITSVSSTAASNCGACDGAIGVTPSGGTPGYTYNWSSGQTTDTLSLVCAGLYTYTVTDANGCTANFSVILNNNSGPTGDMLVTSNDSCFGLCDGYIVVTPIGGTTPFTYSFNGSTAQSGDTGVNLCANTYTIDITDSNSCHYFDTVSITQPADISISGVTTNAACPGICTGTITLTTAGGTPPYQYNWSSGQNTANLSNMCPGTYTVTVKDADSCTKTATFTVGQNTTISAPPVSYMLLCNGDTNGTATANATGGAPPYTYLWNTVPGQATQTAINLGAGMYIATITDTNGCEGFDTATVSQPTALKDTFYVTPITCNNLCNGKVVVSASGGTPGYSYAWVGGLTTDTISNLCSGTYSLTITDANGCKYTDSTALINPPLLTDTNIVVNATCNNTGDGSVTSVVTGGIPPYVYSWSTGSGATAINNLLPGSYILTLRDSTNCVVIDTATVAADTTVEAKAGNDTTLCANSPVTLNGAMSTNASSYAWYQLPAMTLVGTTVNLTVSPATTTSYLLIATDGLCSDSDTVTINVNPLPFANAGSMQTIFLYTNATLGGSPTGPAGSTYFWQPTAGLSDSTSANPVVSPTVTTVYTVTVTSPFGCTAVDTVSIVVLPQFTVPGGFTPNGDGTNDVWNIQNIHQFPNAVVEVFNRWGEELFRSVGYNTPWDGMYNGKPLPVGTYYYVINLNDPRFPKAYTGPVTIMR